MEHSIIDEYKLTPPDARIRSIINKTISDLLLESHKTLTEIQPSITECRMIIGSLLDALHSAEHDLEVFLLNYQSDEEEGK